MVNSQPPKPPSLWRHHKCQAAELCVDEESSDAQDGRGKQARNFSLVFWKRKRHEKAPDSQSHPELYFGYTVVPSANSHNCHAHWSCPAEIWQTGGAYEYFLNDRHINEWILTCIFTCFLLSCTSLKQSYNRIKRDIEVSWSGPSPACLSSPTGGLARTWCALAFWTFWEEGSSPLSLLSA